MPPAPPPPATALPWSLAWGAAASRFYAGDGAAAAEEPASHFRTSVHAGPELGAALARLLLEVDARLRWPDPLDLVDVGAGGGELMADVLASLPPDAASRVRVTAVDVRPRPPGLDARVRWIQGWAPDAVPGGLRGLLVAHELLDDVPCDVVAVDEDGVPRLLLVDEDGVEQPGPSLADDDAWSEHGLDASRARAWLSAWWPLSSAGDRAEVGLPRDDLWQVLTSRLDAGTALAVDYGHLRATRPLPGSLVGYRAGDVVAPVPDGSCNITAHVAVDSLAHRAGATALRQREALQALGVDAALPRHALAAEEPAAYLDALAASSRAAELLDPAGLGAFWWIRTDI